MLTTEQLAKILDCASKNKSAEQAADEFNNHSSWLRKELIKYKLQYQKLLNKYKARAALNAYLQNDINEKKKVIDEYFSGHSSNYCSYISSLSENISDLSEGFNMLQEELELLELLTSADGYIKESKLGPALAKHIRGLRLKGVPVVSRPGPLGGFKIDLNAKGQCLSWINAWRRSSGLSADYSF